MTRLARLAGVLAAVLWLAATARAWWPISVSIDRKPHWMRTRGRAIDVRLGPLAYAVTVAQDGLATAGLTLGRLSLAFVLDAAPPWRPPEPDPAEDPMPDDPYTGGLAWDETFRRQRAADVLVADQERPLIWVGPDKEER